MPSAGAAPPTEARDAGRRRECRREGGLPPLFDDRPVPIEALSKKFSVDPRSHVVVARGKLEGRPVVLRVAREIPEREVSVVDLREGWSAARPATSLAD